MSGPIIFRIGVVLGSQRVVRAGPQITTFVHDVITRHEMQKPPSSSYTLTYDLIDVASLNLPLYDESEMPMNIHSPDGYMHEHTCAWSKRVLSIDAFVFVTPQYNRSVPAGLKNALDYLYNEWAGKPFMIVSYGGHGGTKAAEHLETILTDGLKMRGFAKTVNMTFPSQEFLARAATGQPLGLSAVDEFAPFAGYRGEIEYMWDMLVELLEEEVHAAKN